MLHMQMEGNSFHFTNSQMVLVKWSSFAFCIFLSPLAIVLSQPM